MGGPNATSVPQDFEAAGADYLVLDEGEITIAPFVDHLRTHGIQRRAAGADAVRFGAPPPTTNARLASPRRLL